MAGRFTFHNKFHRSNHHSISGLDTIDSGLDPIASQAAPFMGIFYNILTDSLRTFSIQTDSYQWWSAFTTMGSYSGRWMNTWNLYSTVSSLSDNWNAGFTAYTHFNSISNLYVNLFTTISTFSASWGSPYLMFTNRTQEYTHAKTFSGQDLYPIDRRNTQLITDLATVNFEISTYEWNLNEQQVSFLTLKKSLFESPSIVFNPLKKIFIKNPVPSSKINGGLYTLVFQQVNDTEQPNGYEVEFDTGYRFNDRDTRKNIVNKTLSGITVINFVCVNGLMFGDVIYLSGNF